MLSGLSAAGCGGAVVGGADAMDGDGDGWEPVPDVATLGTGAGGSDGAGCGSGG